MTELRTHFQLFVYGTLRRDSRAAELMQQAEYVAGATVGGVLYDIDGEYPALVVYGHTPVAGEIWRCPNELLHKLDAYEGVPEGLFRRMGVTARRLDDNSEVGCWTYAAGPALSRKLVSARRIPKWNSHD